MEKLESIGKLAGGIAHDFNNLLTPIVGFSDLILLEENLSETGIEDLNAIKTSANRAKKLVNQILVFSNYFKPDIKTISIQSVMKEVITLLSNSLPENVQFDNSIYEEELCIEADSTHIHQVIMNISKNAIQATADKGGKVHLSLQWIEEFTLNNSTKPQIGSFAKICIKDTGEGMTKATIERIFDPFFTTKKANQGTGLGMSVVHGIIHKYDGYIDIISELGTGTEISVYLPINKELKELKVDSNTSNDSKNELKGNAENIMIIDDEEAILKMMKRLMENNGYNTSIFSNPTTALAEFAKDPKKWNLILSDQTMPNLTGVELCRKMLELNENTKIILMTGYSEDVNEDLIGPIGIKKLLLKPINTKELLQEVKNQLASDKK